MQRDNYLKQIITQKRQEIDQLISITKANPEHYLNAILNQSYQPNTLFSTALRGKSLTVIAEVKRCSPTCGQIRQIADHVELSLQYCQGGASAISVLTDRPHFGGSLLDMRHVSKSLKLLYPHVSILRKDFILHPLQLAEAIFNGANAVLLIVNVIGWNLKFLLQEAARLGLEVLTEVHDMSELEIALEAEAPIIGINHRNLSTFEIDLNISKTLKSKIPSHIITVAESGIHQPIQAQQMYELGFDAILVGEALVRTADPTALIKQMKGE